ncbi:MAG: hypothetical protein KF883_10935 [Thermomicrobiales bacterium]|nr:hypothetical protein [Thermomicrobiales bacterium]
MPDTARKTQRSSMRNMLSTLLFVVAGVLLVAALYLFWDDRNQETTPAAPTAVPGRAQLKNVHDALVDESLDVEYGRGSARVADFTPVGQELIVNEQPVYVFVFADPDEREEEMDGLEPADLEVTDSFGDPVITGPLAVAADSNVAVIMAATEDDLAQRVADAVATIP